MNISYQIWIIFRPLDPEIRILDLDPASKSQNVTDPNPKYWILYLGLDRSIATIAGWIKTILTTEQKKTDYNPQVLFFISFYFKKCCTLVSHGGLAPI